MSGVEARAACWDGQSAGDFAAQEARHFADTVSNPQSSSEAIAEALRRNLGGLVALLAISYGGDVTYRLSLRGGEVIASGTALHLGKAVPS